MVIVVCALVRVISLYRLVFLAVHETLETSRAPMIRFAAPTATRHGDASGFLHL